MEGIRLPQLTDLSEGDRRELERFCKQVLDALAYLSQLLDPT